MTRFLSWCAHRPEVSYNDHLPHQLELSDTSSLAGMIEKVGLLTPNNVQQVPFAYDMYTQCNDFGWEQSTAFKKAFSLDVPIKFIGVWYERHNAFLLKTLILAI